MLSRAVLGIGLRVGRSMGRRSRRRRKGSDEIELGGGIRGHLVYGVEMFSV